MASRSIDDLHHAMIPLARAAEVAFRLKGLDVMIYCTFRSLGEQATLYAQGRTAPGKIVTKAQPGQSAHNYGLAFDGVPMVSGKPVWDTGHPAWQTYGEVIRAAGLSWAGDWKRFREFPHAEHPDWKEIAKNEP